jgi:hypothetical protein
MYDSPRADDEPQQCCVTKDKVALLPDRCPPLLLITRDLCLLGHPKKLLDIKKGIQLQIPGADSTNKCIPKKTSTAKGIVAFVARRAL